MVTISGNVTDDEGNALNGVNVTVIDTVNDAVAATTTTDSNGDYSVSVGSNTYHVLLYYDDPNNSKDYNTESYPYIQ
jgi:hypothetical protein